MSQPPPGVLRDWDLPLEVDHILWGQGMDAARVRARRPRLVETAARALSEGRAALEPAAAFLALPVQARRHERLLLDGGALTGPLVVQHLAHAQQVILVVCSVGDALARRAAAIFDHDPALALALNGLASAAAESLAEAVCHHFEIEAQGRGWTTSVPLNPGMIGWPLERGQAEIFALLDPTPIGVRLTPSGLMEPLKSLSLVIGRGPRLERSATSCDLCSMRDNCHYQSRYSA